MKHGFSNKGSDVYKDVESLNKCFTKIYTDFKLYYTATIMNGHATLNKPDPV